MQTPIVLDGSALLVGAIVGAVALGIFARRDAIALKLKRLILYGIVAAIAFRILENRLPPTQVIAASIACGIIAGLLPRSRSRYISARDKRKAIARYESSGRKYNSNKHDIDHRVPFSRGGNNTADNLRVTDRRKNRSKGARSTWWDVLGR